SQLDAIGLRQPGDVGPVVDDEKRPCLARPAPYGSGSFQQLPIAERLLAKLEHRRPTGSRLRNGPVQGGTAQGAGQQYLHRAGGQSLAGAGSQEQRPLQRVAAIAQLLDALAEVATVQLAELLQTAQGLLQALQVGPSDIAQRMALALGGRADRRADIAECVACL